MKGGPGGGGGKEGQEDDTSRGRGYKRTAREKQDGREQGRLEGGQQEDRGATGGRAST